MPEGAISGKIPKVGHKEIHPYSFPTTPLRASDGALLTCWPASRRAQIEREETKIRLPDDQLEGRPVLATRLDCFADRQRAVLAAVSARFSMTVDSEDQGQGDDDGEEDDGEADRSLRVAM